MIKFNGELMDFQQKDVAKLATVPSAYCGSDMGTGKTYVAMALDYVRRRDEPANAKTLVVTPMSGMFGWEEHIAKVLGGTPVVIDPTSRKTRDKFLEQDGTHYIMHWEALRLMPELKKVHWLHIVADEAHRANGRKTRQTKALKRLKTGFKTALTGTPAEDKPDQMYSVLNWLYPREYKNYWRFYEEYTEYVIGGCTPWCDDPGNCGKTCGADRYYKKTVGPKNLPQFRKMIDPFFVRHLKNKQCCEDHPNGVLTDLAEPFRTTVRVKLGREQRRAYNEMRDDMLAWVGTYGDQPLPAPATIAQLTRLSQFAVSYARIEHQPVLDYRPTGTKLDEVWQKRVIRMDEPSAKLDALMELLVDNPTEQFVVFSAFSQVIKMLGARCRAKGISFGKIIGETPKKERFKLQDSFRQGKPRVLGLTVGAGGESIELTNAKTVVFLDRSWVRRLNEQAESRVHRKGQTKVVQIIDIEAERTIDQYKKDKLELKAKWFEAMMRGEDV